MENLKARKPWVGAEGTVKPGDTIFPATSERADQLVSEGRAERIHREAKGGPEAQNEGGGQIDRKTTRKTTRARARKGDQ